jgi:hypothetical protein
VITPHLVVLQENDVNIGLINLYEVGLGRGPDAGGLGFWVGRVAEGMSLTTVAQNFAASPEFQRGFGALSDQAMVQQLYRELLSREGEPAGVAFWTDVARTRGDAAALEGIALAPEAIGLTGQAYDGFMAFGQQDSFTLV